MKIGRLTWSQELTADIERQRRVRLNAELIDPNLTVPIDAIDAGRALDRGELPVLSERIKKRLGELDVNEFFASKLKPARLYNVSASD